MNKIVWVMGQSAAGKETFIKYAAANPDCELMQKLGYCGKKFIALSDNMYHEGKLSLETNGANRTKIVEFVLDFLKKETNAIIMIKWQYTDNDENCDNIRRLKAAAPGVPNEIIMLSVESDILFARLPSKWWWNDEEAANFTQEKMNRLVEVLRNNIIRWQKDYGLVFNAELGATDGYKIIGDSSLKRGKVILLGGCPRAGKTTLAVKLVKSVKPISKLSMDYLSDDFELVKTLLENLVHETTVYGINSVFDFCSYHLFPKDLEKLPFKDELDIYFFGYPNDISVSEIKYNIKHYAKTTDWIYTCSDDYIGETAEKIYAHNIILKEQCEKYGYRFIDTGAGEERDIILSALYEEIIAKI